MRFFVPNDDNPEAAWEFLRQQCGAPPSRRRIYSITFDHDGERAEAIVGRPFHATGATVLAIFVGDPYCVWQRARDCTQWIDPLFVGPTSIHSEVDFELSAAPAS